MQIFNVTLYYVHTGNVLTVKRTNIYKSILSTSLSNLTFLYNFLNNVPNKE